MIKSVKNLSFTITTLTITLYLIFFTFSKKNWWDNIAFEKPPISWLESMLLLSCSLVLLLLFYLVIITSRKLNKNALVLLCLSFIFSLLSIDEKFSFHMKVSQRISHSHKIHLYFPQVNLSGLLLLFTLLIGIISFPIIFKTINKSKSTIILFILAILFSAISIIIDLLSHGSCNSMIYNVQQYTEESIEILGMMFFLNSFLSLFIDYVVEINSELQLLNHK